MDYGGCEGNKEKFLRLPRGTRICRVDVATSGWPFEKLRGLARVLTVPFIA